MTSRVQNRAPFWCAALNLYSEAGLPPCEAAVEHGAPDVKLVGKEDKWVLEPRHDL